jgi:hypothetical protein
VIDAKRSYLNPPTGLRIFVSPSFPLELGFPRVSARILLTFLFAVDAAIARIFSFQPESLANRKQSALDENWLYKHRMGIVDVNKDAVRRVSDHPRHH